MPRHHFHFGRHNDVWHRYNESQKIETTNEQIEVNYRAILTRLRKQTTAKIVLLSPYLLDCNDKELIRADLPALLSIVRKLAKEFADVYIPLDEHFERALKTQPKPHYYSADGVHPNENGAKFIGKLYYEAVAPLLKCACHLSLLLCYKKIKGDQSNEQRK